MRVTDLDKFSLEEIWRPYQGIAPHVAAGARITKPPVELLETADLLAIKSEWSANVLGRISQLRVSIPNYVKHPLADLVRALSPTSHTSPEE